MTEIRIPKNWKPRRDQMLLWQYLEGGGTRAVEVAHRRWGKDEIGLHFTATQCAEKPGTYWHMLPKANQARKVIWTAINPETGKRRIDEAFPPEFRTRTREQEMSIETITGSVWQLVGSDNFNALVGAPPRGIVFSEWALSNPMCWAYMQPILEQNGGWALFIYTSRGRNHGKTMYEMAERSPGWFSQKLTAFETPVFDSNQLENIRQEYINTFGPELGEALYAQEYLCSFTGAVMGAYYATELDKAEAQGRICNVPHQPGIEVDTFWDLGVDDSTAIWFLQTAGRAYNWIDYEEATGRGLEYYAQLLRDKGYVYGNHYMPHDAKKRELGTGVLAKTVKESAEALGIKPVIVTDRPHNMDIVVKEHIPAVRHAIAQSWFDKDKCKLGLDALGDYRALYDEKNKVLGTHPQHNWSSHAADAMRTFVAGYKTGVHGHIPNIRQYGDRPISWMVQ